MWLGANESDGRNRRVDGIRDRDAAAAQVAPVCRESDRNDSGGDDKYGKKCGNFRDLMMKPTDKTGGKKMRQNKSAE